MNRYPAVIERVDNFKQCYARKNKRPLFGFVIGSEYPLYRYRASQTLPDGKPLTPSDFQPAEYIADYNRMTDEQNAYGGDLIYSASAFWGIPWLEAALGCPIVAEQSTGSIYSKSPAGFSPAAIPSFNPSSPWNDLMCRFLDAAARASDGRYPLATTRMRGISDLLSALYGGEQFLFAMMEKPDEVMAVCERLTDFWIAHAKLQLAHIPLFHGGVGSYLYNVWAPANTVWMQEDSAALLSPDLYRTFIEPCNRRIARELNIIVHMHPTGYYPFREYAAMEPRALELHLDHGGPSASQLTPVHREILSKTPLIIWGDISDDDLSHMLTNLPPEGLIITALVADKAHADRIWRLYEICMDTHRN
ncbi:MAG: hypothetical protein HZC28_08015 [Spirochaetes bacterium]|nr:hypothetical protein [Spirochaetota bacterium]